MQFSSLPSNTNFHWAVNGCRSGHYSYETMVWGWNRLDSLNASGPSSPHLRKLRRGTCGSFANGVHDLHLVIRAVTLATLCFQFEAIWSSCTWIMLGEEILVTSYSSTFSFLIPVPQISEFSWSTPDCSSVLLLTSAEVPISNPQVFSTWCGLPTGLIREWSYNHFSSLSGQLLAAASQTQSY